MSATPQSTPVSWPGLSDEASQALNAWALAWETWGTQVTEYLKAMAKWGETFKADNRGATGVPPPPPPPPPRDDPPGLRFKPGPPPSPLR